MTSNELMSCPTQDFVKYLRTVKCIIFPYKTSLLVYSSSGIEIPVRQEPNKNYTFQIVVRDDARNVLLLVRDYRDCFVSDSKFVLT
mgnify:CR=1 FL=1